MMKRRDFVKYGASGLAALVVSPKLSWLMDNPAYASNFSADGIVNLVVTDALKDMVTHNTGKLPDGTVVGVGNPAQCYFWIFQDAGPNPVAADCPGPIIFASSGQLVTVNVTNMLDEPHAFSIPRMRVTTGPIAPNGGTGSVTFRVGTSGTYLYYDDLNAPVNRMMGLHGAFIVMPSTSYGTRRSSGNRPTPYDRPTPNIQQLFNDLGHAPWWPGLAWDEGDPTTDTPPYRQQVWLLHEASPNLFAEVGNFTPGQDYPSATFVQKFLHDPFNPIHDPFNPQLSNNVPQYFTVSGQSGHFSHNNPYICPYSRVGEPVLIRILNAGLWLHSTHIHANHVFVLQHNNRTDVVPGHFDNPIWIDVYTANPLDTYDWLVPYMRPPDVPNDLGIGRDDLELALDVSNTAIIMGGFGKVPGGPPYVATDIPANPEAPFYNPFPGTHRTWPPIQENNTYIPNIGSVTAHTVDPATGAVSIVDCGVMMSPICYPMHDHSEPSQVAQGGNYNCGLISGIIFTGDRKGARPGQTSKVLTFPMRPETGVDPVAHGPDMEPCKKGVLVAAPPFVMPTIEK